MGCGQSKIHLYPRKSKSKTNGKKSGHGDLNSDADEEEEKVGESEKNETSHKTETEYDIEESKISETDCELSVSIIRAKNLSLLQNQEISTSQQNFFEMLDRKIEEGPDYDSNSETEIALEEARLNALVQHWETASLTASMCSSASRSLQSTPIHQVTKLASQGQSLTLQSTNLSMDTVDVGFLTHNTPFKVQHSMEQSSGGQQQQQQQQLMLSNIMQQMTSVPQQTQINVLSQRLKSMPGGLSPMVSTGGVNTTAANQPIPILADASSSPAHLVESRLLPSSLPRAHTLALTPQHMSPQNYYDPSSTAPSSSSPQGFVGGARLSRPDSSIMPTTQLNLPNQMVYYSQPVVHQMMPQMTMAQMTMPTTTTQQRTYQATACFGEAAGGQHSVQEKSSATNTDYRFPAAISVQRLAPQVQRQLRETQELIKDACAPVAAAYSSPGLPVRSQTRTPARRPPTLESKFSQELS